MNSDLLFHCSGFCPVWIAFVAKPGSCFRKPLSSVRLTLGTEEEEKNDF